MALLAMQPVPVPPPCICHDPVSQARFRGNRQELPLSEATHEELLVAQVRPIPYEKYQFTKV